MGVGRSLLKLTVGGGCMLGGMVFPPLLAGEGIAWGVVLATALASVCGKIVPDSDTNKVYEPAYQILHTLIQAL